MTYQSRLQDIEGGPYAPLTEDEINGAVFLLRNRVKEALRTLGITNAAGPFRDKIMSAINLFLTDVCADNKQRDRARIDMDALVDDILYDPISVKLSAYMRALDDIIDDATAIQLGDC